MLAEDNRSCRDYDGYLLYSERTILKSIHLSDETNLNAPIKPFEDPDHMKNVIALSFDYHGGGGKGSNRIFFSDIHFGNIQQINDDGTDRKIVVDSKWGGGGVALFRRLGDPLKGLPPLCLCFLLQLRFSTLMIDFYHPGSSALPSLHVLTTQTQIRKQLQHRGRADDAERKKKPQHLYVFLCLLTL